MNKKQNIQIAVIIVAFGASGFVLYNGFFKGSGAQPSPQSISSTPIPGEPGSVPGGAAAGDTSSSGSQAILPAGDQLDFSVLKSQNLAPQDINYPQLNPSANIGIPEDSLITPTSPVQQ